MTGALCACAHVHLGTQWNIDILAFLIHQCTQEIHNVMHSLAAWPHTYKKLYVYPEPSLSECEEG